MVTSSLNVRKKYKRIKSKNTPVSIVKIKGIQDTIRVNVTERLSIVGFYGAIFIGVFNIINNEISLNQLTTNGFEIAVTRLLIGSFLTIIGICVCQILLKYNFLIYWRNEFLKLYNADLDPSPSGDSINKRNKFGQYHRKIFSIRCLLMTIMSFLLGIAVYFMVSGLFYMLAMTFFPNIIVSLFWIVPLVIAIIVFFLYFFSTIIY